MECYFHNKIAVDNCSNCQRALCKECAEQFSKTLCDDCAEMERRKLVEKNQKLKKFLIWSVPIGAVLGLLLMLQVNPRGDRLIIGAICGAMFPLALRRIWLVLAVLFFGSMELFAGWGIVSSIIGIGLIITGIAILLYIFCYSWIALVLELVLYYMRQKKIEEYCSKL